MCSLQSFCFHGVLLVKCKSPDRTRHKDKCACRRVEKAQTCCLRSREALVRLLVF